MEYFDSDIEFIKRIIEGETEAFDFIYSKYSSKLYSFGLKYLGSASEAEELVQSVFLKVWENRKELKKELSFKSYLFTIAYNDICKFFRRLNYQKQFISDSLKVNSDSSSIAEESLDYQSVLNRVEFVINKLPEKQKIIFRKSKFDGLSTKEIAEELNLSPGTVDNYVSEALKFLRSNIQKEDLIMVLFAALYIF